MPATDKTGSFDLYLSCTLGKYSAVWSRSSSIPDISKVSDRSWVSIHNKVFKSSLKYLFPKIGVGSFEELFHLSCKVSAHFWGAHAAKSAECQPLHVLRAVIKVTVKENKKKANQHAHKTWTHKKRHLYLQSPNQLHAWPRTLWSLSYLGTCIRSNSSLECRDHRVCYDFYLESLEL